MRQLLILIVLVAAGYVGYTVYKDRISQDEETPTQSPEGQANLPGSAPSGTAPPETTPSETVPNGTAPPPELKSKIPVAPGEKHLAPPGVFYMVDRVSAETKDGVMAVVPGDQVKLLRRVGAGKLRVTIGTVDFEVKESQVTTDLDEAREAERKEFLKRGGRR